MKMKKLLLQITFLTLTLTSYLLPQWSTDPNNNLIVGYGQDPKICSDSAGGCYITYNYETTFYPQKLAVERLNRYGYKPWGTLKQILGELPEQWQAEIIEDGEGGVIVSYQDNEDNWPYFITRVRVQKVDNNGNFLWGPTGVRVTLSETNQGVQKLVADGNGGCVVLWQDSLANYSINRIDRDGERVWGDSGTVIGNGQSSSIVRASDGNYYVLISSNMYRINQNGQIINQYNSIFGQLVPDLDGGVVLGYRVWTGQIPSLVAQRKDSLGNNLWQEPYVEIADSLDINTNINSKYNDGYFYYGWSGKKSGIDKVAQFQALRLDGTKLFPEGSIQVGKPPLGGLYVIPLDKNKTAFVYHETNYLPDSLLVQSYDTLGNKLWDTSGILISHPSIEYQSFTTDGNGGFILGGVINNFTVVAQQVSRNGNLGEINPVPVEFISFTGVTEKIKIILSWITATELNNYGFKIERQIGNRQLLIGNLPVVRQGWDVIGFVPGFGTTTEPKSYSFTDKEVATGIYKYRLKQIDFDGSFEYSTIVEVAVGIPTEYLLEQNFPNPFNPTTSIKYDLPKSGNVELIIYDVLGRNVEELVSTKQQAGRYEISFNASGLASGVYIYQLITEKYVNAKKMILLR